MKLELTKTQLENIENKMMLVLPINEEKQFLARHERHIDFTRCHCPVQKGDKDIWIAEEFFVAPIDKAYENFKVVYKAELKDAEKNIMASRFTNDKRTIKTHYK